MLKTKRLEAMAKVCIKIQAAARGMSARVHARKIRKARAEATSAMVAAMDQSGQQVDLRSRNSWLLKMHEVSVGEAAEVLAINTLAPFVLNARLRTMMERVPDDWKFVVNVSASAPHTPATAAQQSQP